MTKICDYCSAMVDDSAVSCPNCNSMVFRPGPPSQQPKAQVTYNIYHGGHPGYQAPPPQPMPPAVPPPYAHPGQHPYHQPVAHPYAHYAPAVSDKSRLVALLLCFFLGWLGIHRFYVGKVGTGLLMILTVMIGFIGLIWCLIDFISIIAGSFKDADGYPLTNWG
jgi:TM2 domain-containing membrane protein YozV